MKIICDAKELNKLCQIATTVSPRKTTLPATQYAGIEATAKKAIARVSNLEQMVLYNLNAEVLEKDFTHIPFRRTWQFSRFEKAKVEIANGKANTSELFCVNGNMDKGINIKVATITDKDAIPIPEVPQAMITLPNNFQKRMGYTLQCVSKGDSRSVLTGVVWEYIKDTQALNMASADGFRLIKVATPIEYAGEPFRIIIPWQAINLVSHFMQGNIKFGLSSDKAMFDNGNMTVITQLIQGNYPQYNSLIPIKEPALTVTISAPLLNQRLNQLRNEIPNIVKMQPTQDGMLSFSMHYEDCEGCEALIPATIKGEGKTAFQKQYMTEASKLFAEMTLEITEPSAPIKVHGDLEGVEMVIMPMFVQWE